MNSQNLLAFLATLSDHAYQVSKPPPGRWSILGSASDDASGFHATAYRHPLTGQVVIAYRGTDDTRDAFADFGGIVAQPGSVLAGLNGSSSPLGIASRYGSDIFDRQVDLAHQFAEQIRSSNPGSEITYTGHSLGGGLAQVEAARQGAHGVTFEAPGMKGYIDSHFSGVARTEQIQNHYRESDLVANNPLMQHAGSSYVYESSGMPTTFDEVVGSVLISTNNTAAKVDSWLGGFFDIKEIPEGPKSGDEALIDWALKDNHNQSMVAFDLWGERVPISARDEQGQPIENDSWRRDFVSDGAEPIRSEPSIEAEPELLDRLLNPFSAASESNVPPSSRPNTAALTAGLVGVGTLGTISDAVARADQAATDADGSAGHSDASAGEAGTASASADTQAGEAQASSTAAGSSASGAQTQSAASESSQQASTSAASEAAGESTAAQEAESEASGQLGLAEHSANDSSAQATQAAAQSGEAQQAQGQAHAASSQAETHLQAAAGAAAEAQGEAGAATQSAGEAQEQSIAAASESEKAESASEQAGSAAGQAQADATQAAESASSSSSSEQHAGQQAAAAATSSSAAVDEAQNAQAQAEHSAGAAEAAGSAATASMSADSEAQSGATTASTQATSALQDAAHTEEHASESTSQSTQAQAHAGRAEDQSAQAVSTAGMAAGNRDAVQHAHGEVEIAAQAIAGSLASIRDLDERCEQHRAEADRAVQDATDSAGHAESFSVAAGDSSNAARTEQEETQALYSQVHDLLDRARQLHDETVRSRDDTERLRSETEQLKRETEQWQQQTEQVAGQCERACGSADSHASRASSAAGRAYAYL